MQYIWNKIPFARLLLPFLVGILFAIYLPAIHMIVFPTLIILFLLIALFLRSSRFHGSYKSAWWYGLLINFFLFLFGFTWIQYNTDINHSDYFEHYPAKEKIVEVIKEPVVKDRSVKLVARVEAVKRQGEWIHTSGKALLYFRKNKLAERIKYGDRLVLDAAFETVPLPQNPAAFNYKRYLSFHNIYRQAFIDSIDWCFSGARGGNPVMAYAIHLRKQLLGIFKKYQISGDCYAVASALILGDKDKLDPQLVHAYASSGALHVLSVSGLHVGIVYLIFDFLLLFFDKFRYGKMIKAVILILLLWFYALLTGLSPSVMRAATMFSFIIVGNAFQRSPQIYNTLCVSAFVLLLLNPFLIMSVGFQLSYLAVLGIVLIHRNIYHWWQPQSWLLDKAWLLTCVSVAAQIATFPLALLYFHQFPNYFILSNLVVIPLATAIIFTGVALLLTASIHLIAYYIARLFSLLLLLLNGFVRWVEHLPYALIQGIDINILQTWWLYAIITCILIFSVRKRARYLQLTMLLLLGLTVLHEFVAYHEKQQQTFIVYDVPHAEAMDFIEGRHDILIADSSLLNDNDKLSYNIVPNWYALGLEKHLLLKSDSDKLKLAQEQVMVGPHFIQFGNEKIALVDKRLFASGSQSKLKVNTVVLSKSPHLSMQMLQRIFDFDKVIFDASNAPWKIKAWKKECDTLHIAWYSVPDSGAYVEKL